MADQHLVSCLCVTRNRVAMLRRAIACFRNQTYVSRELLVVHEDDDPATRDYLAALNEPAIRALAVAASPKLTLGALRNIAVQASRGHYVAQWDDDDWYAPGRLAEQIGAIGRSGRQGCVLARWLMYDEVTQTAYVSGSRAWEGSMVAERSAVPAYPDLRRGEDTEVIARMIAENKLAALDSPHLYVYVCHGANTWERSHWEQNLLPYAQRLSPEEQDRVKSLIT